MKYIVAFSGLIYNNQEAYYIFPSSIDNLEKIVIFAGFKKGFVKWSKASKMYGSSSNNIEDEKMGMVCLYIETSNQLTINNNYSLRFITYLMCLATGQVTDKFEIINIETDNLNNFDDTFKKYGLSNSCNQNVNYGWGVDQDPLKKFTYYGKLLSQMSRINYKKFENALQTYVWAKELQTLPNPQYKYTLFMTLFLSVIEQLADKRDRCECGGSILCSSGKCSQPKGPHMISIQQQSEKLIREFLTGDNIDDAVELQKKLYRKIRSGYLHSGRLRGHEREGGFLGDKVGSHLATELMENNVNIDLLTKKMLELFLLKRK